MQKMATIVAFVVALVAMLVVALARRGAMCPPVRMV
jgi:hypothetical protein